MALDPQSLSPGEALLAACISGHIYAVKRVVEEQHVDPQSCRDAFTRSTPLHCAASHGHLEIVRYLVKEKKCNVACRDKFDNTPLKGMSPYIRY